MEHLEAYDGQTVLVTGGAGCIGSNLTAKLAEIGARVIVLDDLSSAERWNVPEHPNVTFVLGSVVDDSDLKLVFGERPSIVVHLAALFANQNSVEHPDEDLRVNGLGTLKVLQYTYLTGAERFVYASSGCSVYGSKAPLPLTEDYLSIDLDTPYQITKLLGELYCNFFKNFHDLATTRPRFFNVYGPGEIPGRYRNVIPIFTYRAMRDETLVITGTGEETRDFAFVQDVVDGILRAGALPEAVGEAFNLASGVETNILDLAGMIIEMTGSKSDLRHVERRKWDT
ncbi:MAG: NAD-dependent epimerase/dehydratase family protein, partial [Armatimonadota bacterium]